MTVGGDLLTGELTLSARIMPASNATFAARIDDIPVVYKPVAGERPLWDFPDGSLARREVASHLVSQALGWNVVPRTWLRDGPHGLGMVQLWQDVAAEDEAVTLVAAGEVPDDGWCRVLDGLDDESRPVSLIHEDSPALRRMALFDVVVNNADRKGGHVLAMADGHRFGVDHGLTFHTEHKLRTVLWGWLGAELRPDERADLVRLRDALADELDGALSDLLTGAELAAAIARCDVLVSEAVFPAPRGEMPAVPWPVF